MQKQAYQMQRKGVARDLMGYLYRRVTSSEAINSRAWSMTVDGLPPAWAFAAMSFPAFADHPSVRLSPIVISLETH